MYDREYGDDLLSSDKRLKHKWQWCRVASQISEKEIKKWTHFQCSKCEFSGWMLQVCQWSSGDDVNYGCSIYYRDNHILSSKQEVGLVFKTRIDAQICAEKLLIDWLRKQNKIIDL